MAAFVIVPRLEAKDYIWILISTEGHYLVQSMLSFDTEDEARTNIKKVKKAANIRTKVVVREMDKNGDILV